MITGTLTRSFEYHRPGSVEEASSILVEGGGRAAVLAGGTDLLARVKRSLRSLDVVVDLGGLDELGRIEERAEGLFVGATARAWEIARHGTVAACFPALARAAGLVGGVQIRHMATLGGAVCSGLRCQLRDQSRFWRATIGPCLLDGGPACHARPGAGPSCAATAACDLPPALAALGAVLEIHGPAGRRELPVEAAYTGDGLRPLALDPGEIVLGARLPWSRRAPLVRSHYEKLRLRKAVDRPLVGVALALALEPGGAIAELRVAACGQGPAVQLVPGLEPFVGAELTTEVTEAIGRQVSRWFVPSPALRIDQAWRRAVAGLMVRRTAEALARAARRADTTASPPWELPKT